MNPTNPDCKERTATDHTIDPETEFTAAERALISDVTEASNRALRAELSEHRVAMILRAGADVVDAPRTDATGVLGRLGELLANPGSALPADVVDEDEGGDAL